MFLVAGEVIEEVSGKTWDTFVEKRLLEPLQMEYTTTSLAGITDNTQLAYPHSKRFFNRFGGPVAEEPSNLEQIGPAGSMRTNVSDMNHWLSFQLNNGRYENQRLVDETHMLELRKPVITLPKDEMGPVSNATDTLQYGMGWFLMEYRNTDAVVHGGGYPGQRSYVGLLPEKDLGVVILSNKGGTEITQALTYYIFDLFLDRDPLDWSEKFN